MQYQFRILDVDRVNSISRWAFGNNTAFSYPVRHELLEIELSPEQYLEFTTLFGSYIEQLI